MKSCPRCGNTYPDSEVFCEADGTALVSGAVAGSPEAPAMAPKDPAAGGVIECPTCGGKAEPGEIICNFCGTRLQSEAGPAAAAGMARQSTANPENFIPSRDRLGFQSIDDEPPVFEQDSSTGRRIFGALGYSIAAIGALAAGAWLAVHLSARHENPPMVQASPAASPQVAAPTVALARNMQIAIRGGDLAAPLKRDQGSVHKVFDDYRDLLLDTYKRALEGDATLHDAMVVRLHVMPDGAVTGGSVMVSAVPNPSLDAEVVKTVSDWKFPPASGDAVDVDYPLVFATSETDLAALEAELNAKYASLGPGEIPEFASSPSPMPAASPAVAAAPPAVGPEAPPPAVAMVPPSPAPKPLKSHRHRRLSEELASAPRPPRSGLSERLSAAFAANKSFRRVQAYPTSGGMVTLNGKVFDDKAKMLAERTARNVDGVTGVINNLTTDTAQWARNEAAINQQLQSAGLTGVSARVIGDSAYLEGTVKTDMDRERAVTVAVSAAPVKVRTNLIRVDPGFFGF